MKLEEKIRLDIKKSMISKNTERTMLLRTIMGEFNRLGKDIPDEKAIAIMKKMKENAEQLGNTYEVDVLSEFLPNILSEEETINIVKTLLSENNYTMRDMGSIMKTLKSEYGQSMDMKIASVTIKNILNG